MMMGELPANHESLNLWIIKNDTIYSQILKTITFDRNKKTLQDVYLLNFHLEGMEI